jgi:hypothetical protein
MLPQGCLMRSQSLSPQCMIPSSYLVLCSPLLCAVCFCTQFLDFMFLLGFAIVVGNIVSILVFKQRLY